MWPCVHGQWPVASVPGPSGRHCHTPVSPMACSRTGWCTHEPGLFLCHASFSLTQQISSIPSFFFIVQSNSFSFYSIRSFITIVTLLFLNTVRHHVPRSLIPLICRLTTCYSILWLSAYLSRNPTETASVTKRRLQISRIPSTAPTRHASTSQILSQATKSIRSRVTDDTGLDSGAGVGTGTKIPKSPYRYRTGQWNMKSRPPPPKSASHVKHTAAFAGPQQPPE